MNTAWIYLLGISFLIQIGEQSSCIDKSTSCPAWASQGHCELPADRSYMSLDCRKSCRFCGPQKVSGPCKNWESSCVTMAQQGECQNNYEYMEANCNKACNLCEKSTLTGEKTSCVDLDHQCAGWASTGECEKNPTYMLVSCKNSCNVCDNTKDDDDDDGDDDDGDDYPKQPIDEIIVNAANTTQEFEFFYDENNSLLKVEYDMVFTENEWKARQVTSRRKRTAAIIAGRQGGYRWTNNHIRYEYAPGTFYPAHVRQIQAAMNDWSRYTCLTFSQSNRGNRVRFQNSGGCHSRVGMVGGVQVVGLAPNCRRRGVVIHELGHAIGLHHEQTRPDRDSYVSIIHRNIPNQVRFNFQRYSWNVILNLGIPYDYLSIMHYSGTAFSTNNGITIQTKDRRYQNIIGTRHKLSFRDIKTVNLMYNCKRATRGCTLTDAQCPGEGFVGKDCKCWCPSTSDKYIYVYCGSTKTGVTKPATAKPETKTTEKPITKVKTGCFDQHQRCAYWADHNQCQENPNYMLEYCKKSCNVCGKTGDKSCKDLHRNCPAWAAYYCTSYSHRGYMEANCPLSCGKCSSTTDRANDCHDVNSYCWYWAPRGYCGMYRNYCEKSCGLCKSASSSKEQVTACVDNKDSCGYWSTMGYCQNQAYVGYMKEHCKKSCNVCG